MPPSGRCVIGCLAAGCGEGSCGTAHAYSGSASGPARHFPSLLSFLTLGGCLAANCREGSCGSKAIVSDFGVIQASGLVWFPGASAAGLGLAAEKVPARNTAQFRFASLSVFKSARHVAVWRIGGAYLAASGKKGCCSTTCSFKVLQTNKIGQSPIVLFHANVFRA